VKKEKNIKIVFFSIFENKKSVFLTRLFEEGKSTFFDYLCRKAENLKLTMILVFAVHGPCGSCLARCGSKYCQ